MNFIGPIRYKFFRVEINMEFADDFKGYGVEFNCRNFANSVIEWVGWGAKSGLVKPVR